MIRILLAEDQAMVRGALAALLSLEPDMEIVAEVGRGDEVLDAARSNAPDVALLDIEMPGGSGIVAAAQLHELLPSCRILMLTTFGHPGYLKQAIQGGAVGFLTKDAPTAELASAIRRVLAGARVIDPKLAVDALGERDNPSSPKGSGTSSPRPGRARASPISPRGSSFRRHRAELSRTPFKRPIRGIASKPSASPRRGAGCPTADPTSETPSRSHNVSAFCRSRTI